MSLLEEEMLLEEQQVVNECEILAFTNYWCFLIFKFFFHLFFLKQKGIIFKEL